MVCPGCGERLGDVYGGSCPKCGFDLEISEDLAPDARILGDLRDDDFDEPSLIEADGILFYTASKSLSPRAVPRMSGIDVTVPNTRTEQLAMSLIDGKRNVAEIQSATELTFDDIVVALLHLRDKEIVVIDAPTFEPPPEAGFAEPPDPTVRLPPPVPPATPPPSKIPTPAPAPARLPAAKLPAISKSPTPQPFRPPVITPVAAPAVRPASEPPIPLPLDALIPIPEAPPAPAPVPKSNPRGMSHVRVTPKPGETDIETRARRLYEQAMVEKDDGDVLSALNNMKLAYTFCPTNELYKRALEELQASGVIERGKAPVGTSKARALYEQATQAERLGDIDKAQELLEKALEVSKEAMIYNRLGVILAMRRKDYDRGRAMIEKALELAPKNDTYQHNLKKVLARSAADDVEHRAKREPKKGGLLGFLKKS